MKTVLKPFAMPALAAACALAAGCAAPAQTRAIRVAADSGRIQSLDESSQFTFSFPNSHSGPYSSVGRFNAKVESGSAEGQHVTFVLGKSRATRQWEVLNVQARVAETAPWHTLPLQPNIGVSP
jgi:hypothetical protein